MSEKPISNEMWGGRFSAGPSEIMEEINASIGFDWILYRHDIKGSQAHAAMLAESGIIEEKDAKKIHEGLDTILREIDEGKFTFSRSLEDIHMNIEARLAELIGNAAGRLHTARSRNDQIATDIRLYVRDYIDEMDVALAKLQTSLSKKALQCASAVMPGFTHLQSAQPVTLGHHLLAYVEMLSRDRARFTDARKRVNVCPLGAAALAGTSFPIDRQKTSDLLGFDEPCRNSLDAVSARDFLLETLSACSITSLHLSRLAEEMVLWSTPQFNFIKFSDAFTTGSSIMPQKRNPDAAELVRAKTGRIIGALQSLMMVLKGLPLAYSKDLQEDKEPTFDALNSLALVVSAMNGMVKDMESNNTAMKKAAGAQYSTATDLADWLVQNLNMPFRKAHHVTGQIVALAESEKSDLMHLSLEKMQEIEPGITDSVFSVLSPAKSVASRTSFGGTAPKNVRSKAKSWINKLAKEI